MAIHFLRDGNNKKTMKDVTLISVNWNQQPAMEVMLKSYLANHYAGEQMNVLIADNGSTDGSRGWLKEQGVPCIEMTSNIGHENATNELYAKVKTKYCLLVDTDIEFTGSIEGYLDYLMGDCIAVGELIGEITLSCGKIKPRLGAWLILFDIEKARSSGIDVFRDPAVTDWSYDVGSWFFEKVLEKGFTCEYFPRLKHEAEVAYYDKFIHYGSVSWNMDRPEHGNRVREINEKREFIKQRVESFNYIDIKDKFI